MRRELEARHCPGVWICWELEVHAFRNSGLQQRTRLAIFKNLSVGTHTITIALVQQLAVSCAIEPSQRRSQTGSALMSLTPGQPNSVLPKQPRSQPLVHDTTSMVSRHVLVDLAKRSGCFCPTHSHEESCCLQARRLIGGSAAEPFAVPRTK